MAFLRVLIALTLSISLVLACKTFDSVRVVGDWPLDDFNTTIEQFGVMKQASDCVYQVTISNLVSNTKYNWKVVINSADWNVTLGCTGKDTAPCTFTVGASGKVLLKFDPLSFSISSEYVALQRATRGTCSKSYTVVAGDYCYLIATNNGMTTDVLISYNPGLDCNNLQIGVVLCLVAPTSTVVELGYTGMDIQGGDITSVTGVTSSLACALLCDANANCKAWVWSFPGSGCPTNTNTCWLKGTGVGARVASTCRELGFKLGQAGVDRTGGDLPGMPLVLGTGATTAAACGNACKSTSGCVAWSFDSCGGRNCWLKSSVTGTSANTCRVSGVQGNVNVDLAGADLPGTPAVLSATATATDCSMLCASTAGCNSWAFVTPGPSCETVNNCWMKSSAPAVNSGTAQSCRASLSQPGLSAPTTAPTTAPTASPTTKAPTNAPTAAPTTKAPTSAPTTAPTTAPASTKVGYAWDGLGNAAAWSTGKVSWYYTWSPVKANSNKQFVPMLWGPGQAVDFQNKLNSGYFSGVSCILGFNEPDQGGQANLLPAAAVTLWRQYMQPLAGRYRLGAPVVSSASGGKPWLQSFLSLCTGCTIDFIPLHWYGSDPNLFSAYITDIHNTFGKNIWVTEFACVNYGGPPCDQNSVYSFMGQTTLWLDQQNYVERYSWFGARVAGIPVEDATLTADGGSLTALGNQFVVVGGHQ